MTPFNQDDLDPMRGLFLGLALGIAVWLVLAAVAYLIIV